MQTITTIDAFRAWCQTHRWALSKPANAVAERVFTDMGRALRDGSGDQVVRDFTREFDHVDLSDRSLRVDPALFDNLSYDDVFPDNSAAARQAILTAIDRVRAFHASQREHSWLVTGDGVAVGQRITPLDRVGIYVPGGQAPLLSSLIMCAVPAQVAGVRQIAIASPPGNDYCGIAPAILLVARALGIKEIYAVGGAQAIAALALGTETIAKVDKIVGPGNQFVAAAKRRAFGLVDIDMIAGPSEVMIICDETADPEWVAADLLSQLEHGSGQERAVCVSWHAATLVAVHSALQQQLEQQQRKELIQNALAGSACVTVANPQEAIEAANAMAPEHLELAVDNPRALLDETDGIRHAGAIFLGPLSCETLGDYTAGPNHTLPTGGTARFFSPLGVYDFVKRSSLIKATDSETFAQLARHAITLAELEGLAAHAAAMQKRLPNGS